MAGALRRTVDESRVSMERIGFHQLPLWVRLASALVLVNTFILIAEFGIDRYGLDDHLPFYRYGDICVWDIAVVLGVALDLRGEVSLST